MTVTSRSDYFSVSVRRPPYGLAPWMIEFVVTKTDSVKVLASGGPLVTRLFTPGNCTVHTSPYAFYCMVFFCNELRLLRPSAPVDLTRLPGFGTDWKYVIISLSAASHPPTGRFVAPIGVKVVRPTER